MSTLDARFHHLHLTASDAAAAADWYARHLGGQHHSTGEHELARFGETSLIWYQANDPSPSVGSVVDHFGWSLPVFAPVLEAMLADGARLLDGPRRVGPSELHICFVEDPWGAKLELLEDSDVHGFHHVHLLVNDIEPHRQTLASELGGKPEIYNQLLPGLRFERMWILYRETPEGRLAPSRGRAIDHLAFRVADVEAAAQSLAAGGFELEGPARDVGRLRVVFAEAPAGLRIELVAPL